jgi:hypothetical protein
VSCYHNSIVPPNRSILGAKLIMHASRIFGVNPFANGSCVTQVDMVRGLRWKPAQHDCPRPWL